MLRQTDIYIFELVVAGVGEQSVCGENDDWSLFKHRNDDRSQEVSNHEALVTS